MFLVSDTPRSGDNGVSRLALPGGGQPCGVPRIATDMPRPGSGSRKGRVSGRKCPL